MKILIVDDEKRIRDVVREYCYNESYEVVEAENGLEAISKVKEISPNFLTSSYGSRNVFF